MSRRQFLRGLAASLSAVGLSACGIPGLSEPASTPTVPPTFSPSPTLTATPRPTWTPTPLPTFTPTPTLTPTPVQAGTSAAALAGSILETNLAHVVELSRWGRGMTRDLAWSPSGGLLAAATDLGVYLYDPETLQVQALLDQGYAHQIAFSSDGRSLAAAGFELLLWDLQSRSFQTFGRVAQPYALRFSADGRRLSLVSQNNADPVQFETWDVASRQRVAGASLANSTERITAAALSPGLDVAAAHSQKGKIRFWRQDGSQAGEITSASPPAGPFLFSPDGASLLVAYPDTAFDFQNSNLLRVYSYPNVSLWREYFSEGGLEGFNERLLSLAFSPDGAYFAAGFSNRAVHVWRSQPGPVTRFLSGGGVPTALAFSPDGSRLAGGGLDLWAVPSSALLHTLPEHFSPLDDLAVSPQGDLVVLSGNGQVQLRYLPDGGLLRLFENPPDQVTGLSFSPDGRLLSGAGSDGTVRLWRVSDGRYLTEIGDPTLRMWATAFSPDGKNIVLSGENGLVQIYDIERNLVTTRVREPYVASRLLFSPVGTLFVSLTSSSANIRDTKGVLTREVAGLGLEDAAFSPDGGLLALAGSDLMRVVDVGTGKDRYTHYDPTRAQPSAVAFSPEGAFLGLGRSDGTIDLFWAADGRFLRTLAGHRGRVTRLFFTPSSLQLVSTAQDATVRVWGVNKNN